MNYILFDDNTRIELLPITYTRPVADIRFGILTIREKWEYYLEASTFTLTEEYLSEKFPLKKEKNNILINSSICPNELLVEEVKSLKPNEALVNEELIIAYYLVDEALESFELKKDTTRHIQTKSAYYKISNLWDLFSKNAQAIEDDYAIISKVKKQTDTPKSLQLISPENIFIEEGAKLSYATINASAGPVFIGKNAEIMENVSIRGPVALCENSVLKMGAKIYGATTIGPNSKIGGELNNCIFLGHSNKAHDGFLGNAVIGEWCNLGADTNNSNLKNNYEPVKIWNYYANSFVNTGLQFCGLFMGDHSKSGINTMFNTGTVVGVNVNVFGSGFQRNFIPSFSWGGVNGFMAYDLEKAIEVAERVYQRRGKEFDETEKNIFRAIYKRTKDLNRYRK